MLTRYYYSEYNYTCETPGRCIPRFIGNIAVRSFVTMDAFGCGSPVNYGEGSNQVQEQRTIGLFCWNLPLGRHLLR